MNKFWNWVRNEDTGLCVHERDPAALADAMERLLKDTRLREALAIRARQLIEKEFDIQKNAGLLQQLFKTAAAQALLPEGNQERV